MSTEAALITLAIVAAIGVTLVVAAFAPTRPRLADVLHETPQGLRHGLVARADRLKLIAKPVDLALVGQSRESFVVQRLGLLLVGALWIPVLTVVLALVGAAPPILLTGAASVGCALLGWQMPVIVLKSKVKHARTAFTGALAAYCRLVALGRLGDRGPVEALRYPAALGSARAGRSGGSSWPSTKPPCAVGCPGTASPSWPRRQASVS